MKLHFIILHLLLVFFFFLDHSSRYKTWKHFSIQIRNYKTLWLRLCTNASSSWGHLYRLCGHTLVQSSRISIKRYLVWKVCVFGDVACPFLIIPPPPVYLLTPLLISPLPSVSGLDLKKPQLEIEQRVPVGTCPALLATDVAAIALGLGGPSPGDLCRPPSGYILGALSCASPLAKLPPPLIFNLSVLQRF